MTLLDKTFIFDFDDTLWSRDNSLIGTSMENLRLLQKLSENSTVVIISGNSISHIKLCFDLSNIIPSYDIWADSNSTLFKEFREIKVIDDFILDNIDIDYIRYLVPTDIRQNMTFGRCFIKIKPFYEQEYRSYICDLINQYINSIGANAVAIPIGKTSIDVLSKSNNKSVILSEYNGPFSFFGDEIDSGNDRDIALLCHEVFKCNSVLDTNRRLKELCYMD